MSPAVERAFRQVPLHRFMDTIYRQVAGRMVERRLQYPAFHDEDLQHIYLGGILLHRITDGAYRAILPAHLIGSLLEYLELDRGMKVLVIGDDSGYIGALVSEVVGRQQCVVVVPSTRSDAMAVQRMLARAGYGKVAVDYSDCYLGAEASAPYDRVLVSVGCGDISDYWMKQIRGTGFALVPLYHGGWFPIVRIETQGASTEGRVVGSAGTVIPEIGGFLAGGMKSAVEVTMPRGATLARLWSHLSPDRLKDYWYYTSLRSREACILHLLDGKRVARGFGLYRSDQEWAMMVSRRHEILGDRATVAAMEDYYRKWRSIGEPRTSSYSIEFVPLDVEAVGDNRWAIERRFFRQEVWMRD